MNPVGSPCGQRIPVDDPQEAFLFACAFQNPVVPGSLAIGEPDLVARFMPEHLNGMTGFFPIQNGDIAINCAGIKNNHLLNVTCKFR